jgi:Icc protein
MPIHLPPLSRRQFLTGSLAAGAGLLLGDRLLADASSVDANRFVLLADIHIWEHRDRDVRGIRPATNFLLARQEFLALAPRPAAAIVAGDCVFDQGQAADYAVLAELVQPIRQAGLSLHLVLGNHDNRENLYATFPDARPSGTPPVVDKHIAVLETPNANWFLLDSLHKTKYTPGRLGTEQLDWLARALDARPDKPALVVAHHYPDQKPKTSGLEDTQALFDVLLPRKQVKAYVFGHSHRWAHQVQDGFHLVNLPTPAWIFDETQPRGWVDARLRPDGASLTLHALDKTHKANAQTLELTWRT